MFFTKKYIILYSFIILSHMCYGMESIEKKDDLLKFAQHVVAYQTDIDIPGYSIQRHPNKLYTCRYAYIDTKPWTIEQYKDLHYTMRILLPYNTKNQKQGFELIPERLKYYSLKLRSIDSTDKKNILTALKNKDVKFSKGLNKGCEKSSNIILSLIE